MAIHDGDNHSYVCTSDFVRYLADNELILFLQIIGFAISFAFIVMILILDKHGKQYLKKMSFFASLWFASCLALADFNQPTLKLIIQLYTAFLFIFDACIIPDFLSSIDPKSQKEKKILMIWKKKYQCLKRK